VEPWELAAREEIRDLIARYNQFGDHARFEDMAELFTEDATLEVDGRDPINGRNEIRDFLAGVRDSGVAGRAEQGKPPTYVRHHTSTVVIDLESPTEASGTCYFFVVTDIGPDHWGRYRDRYVLEGGRWRFAYRRARTDGQVPGSWSEHRDRA